MLTWSREPSQHYRFWEERHPTNLPAPRVPALLLRHTPPALQPLHLSCCCTTNTAEAQVQLLLWELCIKNSSLGRLLGLILAPLLLLTEPPTHSRKSPVKQMVLRNITGDTSGNYHSLYIFQGLGFVRVGYTLAIFLVLMGHLNNYIEVLGFSHGTWNTS